MTDGRWMMAKEVVGTGKTIKVAFTATPPDGDTVAQLTLPQLEKDEV